MSHQLPVWIARLAAEDRRLWHDPRSRQCTLASLTSLTYDGDTLAAIEKFGVESGISYISTGGGAFLEFVEGKTLPAVAALEARFDT